MDIIIVQSRQLLSRGMSYLLCPLRTESLRKDAFHLANCQITAPLWCKSVSDAISRQNVVIS